MAQIRIRVGAAIDASLDQVFAKVSTLARKASATVAREAKAGADAQTKAYAHALTSLEKANAKELASTERTASRELAITERVAQQKVRAELRAFDQRVRAAQRASDAEERGIMRTAAAVERAEQRKAAAAAKSREAAARGIAHGAYSQFGNIARAGVGTFGSIARGAGVSFDVGSLVRNGVDAETKATDLANSAFQPGEKGSAGVMQNPTSLLNEARAVAKATAFDTNTALDGLSQFVGKTGDLETGRAIFASLAKLSRATGTSLNDMASASADVSTALGDIPNKAGVIEAVMKSIAGQGKLGAVEISDLAKEMAKVASAAGSFKGDKADTLAVLGAITQEARQRGGATSAASAATSTAAFARDLVKDRSIKAFSGAGIDVFADKGHTALKGPQEIITQALTKTNGDLAQLAKLFPNAMSMRSVKGFANVFNDAGGGDKGAAAVAEEFDKLKRSAMGQGAIQEQFNNAMNTTSAKAQVFQTNLEEIAQRMASRVLPELEKLAPKALAVADAFASIIGYAAENPFKAAAAALAVSIAKAGIDAAIKTGIEAAVSGAAKGGFGGALGTAGLALTVAMATIAIESAVVDQKHKEGEEKSKSSDEEINYHLSEAEKKIASGQALTPSEQEQLGKDAEVLRKRIKGADSHSDSQFGRAFEVVTGQKSLAEQGQEAFDKASMGTLMAELKGIAAAMEAAKPKGGVQEVRVVNQPVPGVDHTGRTGPPGAQ